MLLKAADGLKELREQMVLKQFSWQRWGELAPEDAFNHMAPLPESQWKLNTLRNTPRDLPGKTPNVLPRRLSPYESRHLPQ